MCVPNILLNVNSALLLFTPQQSFDELMQAGHLLLHVIWLKVEDQSYISLYMLEHVSCMIQITDGLSHYHWSTCVKTKGGGSSKIHTTYLYVYINGKPSIFQSKSILKTPNANKVFFSFRYQFSSRPRTSMELFHVVMLLFLSCVTLSLTCQLVHPCNTADRLNSVTAKMPALAGHGI